MQTITKKLIELKRPEKNVRLHGDRQIKEYVRSIKMFGQIRPLVIDEFDTVLAGNGLLTALEQMGVETADCYVVSGLTENKKKKLMLADNKIFELGINDMHVFDEMIAELSGDFDVPGYEPELLKTLMMNPADLEEFSIRGYGKISDEEKSIIQRNEVVPKNQPQNLIEETETPKVEIPHKYVLCPKCGEKIWL